MKGASATHVISASKEVLPSVKILFRLLKIPYGVMV